MEGDAAPVANEHAPFLMMEDILERLKMLDYEINFKSFKPLT